MMDNKKIERNNGPRKLRVSPLRRCQVHVATPLSELVSTGTGIFSHSEEMEGSMRPDTGADAE